MVINNNMYKYHYKCINCEKEYSAEKVRYLCPNCSSKNDNHSPPAGILKTIYNFTALKKSDNNFTRLYNNGFIDILPINSLKSLPNLRVGKTPIYKIDNLDNKSLPFNIYLKDDSQNPTYSLKDRASALVSAYAKENGIETIVAASTGNAGSSLSGMCAVQRQHAVIIVPKTAPAAKLIQIIMYGAHIIPIDGNYDDAFNLSIQATEYFGWYNRNTAFNPFTVEGKKTVSFELFRDLNEHIPDTIFVPVGDGVIISAVYKGFEDLLKLGIIHKIPLIIAVQAQGSNNIIRNLNNLNFIMKPANTIADSISVDYPRNFYMTKHYLNIYGGETIAVSDTEILNASSMLAKNTGIFSEPAAAAAFAGMLRYWKTGMLNEHSNNVVLLTGSGLKDINSMTNFIKMPEAIKPDIDALKLLLK